MNNEALQYLLYLEDKVQSLISYSEILSDNRAKMISKVLKMVLFDIENCKMSINSRTGIGFVGEYSNQESEQGEPEELREEPEELAIGDYRIQ